jgi:hypothetical protein
MSQINNPGQDTLGISNLGNTAGTSGVATGPSLQLLLAGGNNITLSQSLNGGSATISIVGGAGGGGSAAAISIGGNSTSGAGGYSNITSGTALLAGGNNITLSQNASAITISAANQTNQLINFYAVGNTASTSTSTQLDARTVSFDGAGIISVGMSAGSIIMSATTAAQTNQAIGLYAVGNTASTSTSTQLDARTISFNGAGNASVGFSAGSVIISDAGAAVSIGGNSTSAGAGYSNVSTGTVVLAGGNNITLSQNGSAITIVGGAGGGVDVQIGGNTSGTTALVSTGTLTLAGGNNITLSQNGNAITISEQDFIQSQMFWPADWNYCQMSLFANSNAQYSIIQVTTPLYVTFSRVDVPISFSGATINNTSSAYFVQSAMLVLYTLNGGTALSPIVGASRSDTLMWQSNTVSQLSSFTGGKLLSFPLASMITPGTYFLGCWISTSSGFTSGGGATTALNATVSMPVARGLFNPATANFANFGSLNTSSSNLPLGGLASVPSATNNTYNLNAVSMSGSAYGQAQFAAVFRNV